jgi:hypothetical protein
VRGKAIDEAELVQRLVALRWAGLDPAGFPRAKSLRTASELVVPGASA